MPKQIIKKYINKETDNHPAEKVAEKNPATNTANKHRLNSSNVVGLFPLIIDLIFLGIFIMFI